MKKLIVILGMVISAGSSAQTIGDNLDYIQQKSPSGNLKLEDDSTYTYYFEDPEDKTMWAYFLNSDMICICIGIDPIDEEEVNEFMDVFDSDWIKYETNTWNFYREDGSVIQATYSDENNNGMFFIVQID